ncbi:MAG: hypothetical protein GXP04_08390 [Alphaproteobacteria bacterium]|nr:hypothetical protein [Alphaproteobacteria bacterium]
MSKKTDEQVQAFTIPHRIITDLLRDTSPEMAEVIDDVTADLQLIDAAQIGLFAARTRAANQFRQPEWLEEIAAIIRREMAHCSERLQRARKKDVA